MLVKKKTNAGLKFSFDMADAKAPGLKSSGLHRARSTKIGPIGGVKVFKNKSEKTFICYGLFNMRSS